MAKLIIMYDPNDRVHFDNDQLKHLEIDQATLTLAEDLEKIDIYNVAKKLSELLLEQL